MTGLVNGIYKLCSALTPVTLAVLILMLVLAGISTIFSGDEGRVNLKDKIKMIVIGAAVAFGATQLGKEIASWFM